MTTGIMIAGHGSTMAYNKGVLEMQADRLRSKGYDNVYVGFNEFSIPSIRETAEEMVEDGYDEILILPFFVALMRLRHRFWLKRFQPTISRRHRLQKSKYVPPTRGHSVNTAAVNITFVRFL